MRNVFLFVSIFLAALVSVSCNQQKNKSYDNPFSFCEAKGTVDGPSESYTGKPVPFAVAEELKKKIGVPDTPTQYYMQNSTWRCMDGKVYACTVGANLPCSERADMSKEPNEGMLNYCGENPDDDLIPMYATGRATVYEWKCKEGSPEIVKQIAEADKAGYLKGIWYEITPVAKPAR